MALNFGPCPFCGSNNVDALAASDSSSFPANSSLACAFVNNNNHLHPSGDALKSSPPRACSNFSLCRSIAIQNCFFALFSTSWQDLGLAIYSYRIATPGAAVPAHPLFDVFKQPRFMPQIRLFYHAKSIQYPQNIFRAVSLALLRRQQQPLPRCLHQPSH